MRDNYPPGAYEDPSAPYNEPIMPEKEFEVTISQTLSKTVTVITNKDVSKIDWNEIYEEQHYTIPELLEQLQIFAEKELENVSSNSGRGRELQHIIEACKDWIVDDYEVVEE